MTKQYRTTKQMVAVLLETCNLVVTRTDADECRASWANRTSGDFCGRGIGRTYAMALRCACEAAWLHPVPTITAEIEVEPDVTAQ